MEGENSAGGKRRTGDDSDFAFKAVARNLLLC